MNLRKREIRSSSFKHYFGQFDLPTAMSDAEKVACMTEMLAGDDIARDKLVMSHLRLALSIVGRYVTVLGHSRYADLFSAAAFHAMLKKAERVRERCVDPDFNITAAFVECIHSAICYEHENLKLMKVPRRTNRYRRKKGLEPIPDPTIVGIDFIEKPVIDGEAIESTIKQGWWRRGVKHKVTQTHGMNATDLKNVICDGEFEQSVFDLRVNSEKPLPDREIAERLGVSAMTVCNARRRIGERLQKEIQL